MSKMEIIERMVGTLVTAGVVEGNQAQMCTYVLTDTLKDCNIDEVKTKEVIVSGTQKNSDAIKYFMIVCATSNRSPRTIDSEVRAVKKLLLEIQKPYDEITGDEILAWFAHHKIRTGCSDVTMSNYQHFISAFYRTMKKHDKIKYNPMEKIEPIKHASKLKTPLTVMEIESVKGACHNSRDLAIVTMMLETGVRVSELCGMNKRDVDFINCTAIVLGKGNKERMVHFTGKTVFAVQKYLQERKDANEWLFANKDRPYNRMDKKMVEALFRKMRSECGVNRLHPHLLRATYATGLATRGINLTVIAKLLGHNDLESTRRYVLMDETAIKANLAKIGSIA